MRSIPNSTRMVEATVEVIIDTPFPCSFHQKAVISAVEELQSYLGHRELNICFLLEVKLGNLELNCTYCRGFEC